MNPTNLIHRRRAARNEAKAQPTETVVEEVVQQPAPTPVAKKKASKKKK